MKKSVKGGIAGLKGGRWQVKVKEFISAKDLILRVNHPHIVAPATCLNKHKSLVYYPLKR